MISEDELEHDKLIFKSFLSRIASKNRLSSHINKVFKMLDKASNPHMYDSTHVYKAKAQIGEIREWKTGKFKKVSEGQWVKVSEDGKPESGEEIVDDLAEQTKHNITLNEKQKAYLKEKLDKLKFFNIATLEKNPNTNAILQAVKEKNPDLEISDDNKGAVIAEMQTLIKDLLQKKLDDIAGVNEALQSPDADPDAQMALATKKTEYYDKTKEVFEKNPTKDPSLKKLQEKVINDAIESGNWKLADGMISSIEQQIKFAEGQKQESITPESLPEDKDTKYPSNQKISDEHPAKVKYGDLKFISNLGGSTGAVLLSDSKGNKYVAKSGKSEQHIQNEYQTNDLYSSVGLNVPDIALKTVDGKRKQLAKLVDGVTLGQYLNSASPDDKEKIKKELQKGFMYDAILANWDVIGMSKDNIIVSKDGKPYRIDNGGSMIYRAQGGLKDFKGGLPAELQTMRDFASNSSAHAIYGSMTDDDLATHILNEEKSGNLQKFRDAILKSDLDPDRKSALQSRITYTFGWAKYHEASQEPPIPEPQPEPHTAPKFKSDMGKHMATISNWSKKNLLSSAKLSDFVKYAQDKHSVDFTNMEKDEITSYLKKTWADLSQNAPSGNFVLKSGVSQQRGFMPPDSSYAKSYAKIDLSKLPQDFKTQTYNSGTKHSASEAIKKYHDSLPSEIQNSIKSYTGSGYNVMNKTLRGVKDDATEEVLDHIAKTDAYLRLAPKFTGDTYRGVKYGSFVDDMISALDTGEPYEMKGFSSSATKPDKAWSGGGSKSSSVFLQIKSKTGVFVDPVSSHKGEDEVLHNTHMKYKVVSYKKIGVNDPPPIAGMTLKTHGHHIVLEEI